MLYLGKGLRLLFHPRLRGYVILPILINTIVLIAVVMTASKFFSGVTAWLVSYLPSWLSWLHWLIYAMFILAILLLALYSFTFLANLISAPFNTLLALKTQRLLYPEIALQSQFIWYEMLYTIKMQCRLLLYFLPRALVCGILFLIPILQIAAPFAWLYLNAWFHGLLYLDYPAETHYFSFSALQRFARQHRSDILQLGSSTLLLNFIPGINLVIMPAAVIGATILLAESQATDR